MDRERTIAFEMNYCQHYDPQPGSLLRKDVNWCKAGQDIEKVCVREGKPPFFKPCIGGHDLPDPKAVCPHWVRRTREMGEARADRVEASMNRMKLVGPVVAAWRTWTKKNRVAKQEVIDCPTKCGGKLHLSQAALNGHVCGKCTTEGCVSWME